MTTTVRAIIYARFSPRRNEDECESIETQLELCRRHAQAAGMEVAGEFSDRALSGDDEDRPGLWDAIEALKPGDVLLVYRLDRLARSVYLSYIIEQEVTKKRALIVSTAGEGTASAGPEDELVRRILQALAEYERKVIAARTKAAMRRHQATGRRMSSVGKLPWGWMPHPDDPKRMLENDDERRIAAEARAAYATGLSVRGVCKWLADQGYSCRGGAWHYHLVKKMVSESQAERRRS